MNSLRSSLLSTIFIALFLAGCSVLPHKKPDTTPDVQTKPTEESKPSEPTKQLLPGQNSDGSYNSLWDRIRNGHALPDTSDALVRKDLQWYANNQRYLNRVLNQSKPYLHYVIDEMEAHQLPLELAFIPIIESAYNPRAVSPYNNVGLWQFTSLTGKNFGLKQNAWYNGRKDPVASTDAAIRYLKRLSKMFDGDWLLVIAAYNAGEGAVNKAIAKNKRAKQPTDYWSLALPKHTEEYIPKLIALSKVLAEPAKYNINLIPIADAPYFTKINLVKPINISQAATQANLDAEEIKEINAGFTTGITEPDNAHPLLIPVADAEKFTQQMALFPDLAPTQLKEPQTQSNATGGTYHTIKAGDTLSSIARMHKTSVTKLIQLNGLNAKSTLKLGQKIKVN